MLALEKHGKERNSLKKLAEGVKLAICAGGVGKEREVWEVRAREDDYSWEDIVEEVDPMGFITAHHSQLPRKTHTKLTPPPQFYDGFYKMYNYDPMPSVSPLRHLPSLPIIYTPSDIRRSGTMDIPVNGLPGITTRLHLGPYASRRSKNCPQRASAKG